MSINLRSSIIVVCLCMISSGRAGITQDKPAPQAVPEARPADVASIEAIIAAVYDVISGPAGQQRDWNRMRSLFVPGARLIPVSQAGGVRVARVLSVEEYIARTTPLLEGKGFFEREIARREEKYAHIAHVFSTYESRREAKDRAPFSRGINSFQLMNDGSRWWIVTVFWEAEGPDTPIPQQYLK